MFQSAAGATREEKLHACRACPLVDTKPVQIGDSRNETEAVVDRVERLARERDSGRKLSLDSIDALIWELLLVWDVNVAAYKRAHEQRVAALFEALLTRS